MPGLVPNWDNDYISLSLSAGYSIDANTEVHANYYYYKADNYLNNAALTTPYGQIAEEHVFTLELSHRFSENILGSLSYGYYVGDDGGAGGFNDYTAHALSTGIRYSF